MSLHCEYGDGYDWYFAVAQDEAPLATKYSRKCCSCRAKLMPGAVTRTVTRWASCQDDSVDYRIYGAEKPLATWYLCETCSGLEYSLAELGFCYELGIKSLKDQIAEYRSENS